jgi:hypothetical protein
MSSRRGGWAKRRVYPVRNSGGALNTAEIILKANPTAEQRLIISNGVKEAIKICSLN